MIKDIIDSGSMERRIVSVESHTDRTATVTYECGHSAVWIIPPAPSQTRVPACAECVQALLRESREQVS